MMPSKPPVPLDDIQGQLNRAQAQLTRYAQDLKRLLAAKRRKTQALAEAHARLQRLDQLKTDFLTFIAHELRTPLAILRGFAELLLEGDFTPGKQRQFLTVIHREAIRLTDLITSGGIRSGHHQTAAAQARRVPRAAVAVHRHGTASAKIEQPRRGGLVRCGHLGHSRPRHRGTAAAYAMTEIE